MEKDTGKSELLKQELDQMLLHPKDFGITEEEAGYLKSGGWSKKEIIAKVTGMREELRNLHQKNQADRIHDLKKRIDIFDRVAYFME